MPTDDVFAVNELQAAEVAFDARLNDDERKAYDDEWRERMAEDDDRFTRKSRKGE